MPQVYLLRGLGGYAFSSGIDTMAAELRRRRVSALVEGYTYHHAMTSRILREKPPKVVMIGHSQGANNSILSAINLQRAGVKVDLLVCLCPVGSWYYPPNVKRVLNFYTGSWGNAVPAQDPNQTDVLNFDYSSDWSVWHLNIDKVPAIQSTILSTVFQTLGVSA